MSLSPDVRFGLVPEWVIAAEISDKAFRLYCVLACHCDYNTGASTPGRKTLASRMGGVSLDTVDRAKKELVEAGAITVKQRTSGAGDPTSNVYTLVRERPGRTDAATAEMRLPTPQESDEEGRTDAATKVIETSSIEKTTTSNGVAGRQPTVSGGRKVTAAEHDLIDGILLAFNEASGKRFAGREWRESIVRRIRDHPDMSLQDHIEIIKAQFSRPWWKDDPSPSVIYGNGKVFDRARNGALAAPKAERPSRYSTV